jgi:predicted transcriptional regulator
MQAEWCYHAYMAKQLTIRGVSDEVADRLDRLSRESGQSVNTTVNRILEEALGVDGRRRRLERYATWTPADAAEFDAALAAQRGIDEKLWR